jgi:hypothetical protein
MFKSIPHLLHPRDLYLRRANSWPNLGAHAYIPATQEIEIKKIMALGMERHNSSPERKQLSIQISLPSKTILPN